MLAFVRVFVCCATAVLASLGKPNCSTDIVIAVIASDAKED